MMGTWKRMLLTGVTLWLLVATNPGSPDSRSFRRFLSDLKASHRAEPLVCRQPDVHEATPPFDASATATAPPHPVREEGRFACVESRRAFPELNSALESLFAPHRSRRSPLLNHPLTQFESVDYGVFTLVRTKATPFDDDFTPHHGFLGILSLWLPYPHPARLTGSTELRHAFNLLRSFVAAVRTAMFDGVPHAHALDSLRRRTLPDRPWEWLIALFTSVGAIWLLFPTRACDHLTLTWQNLRDRGHWWCLVLFHFSHGGSWLRLCRTIVSINYLAPVLVSRGIVTLSGLYGVVLTSSATSTALGMLVLARRYVFTNRAMWPRVPLEINGGGACVYALLVVACLSPTSCVGYPFLGGARPFELLMLNVLFDSFFLAGQKRIADYTAHTGAALGAWLFYSVNLAS